MTVPREVPRLDTGRLRENESSKDGPVDGSWDEKDEYERREPTTVYHLSRIQMVRFTWIDPLLVYLLVNKNI